MTEKSSRKTRLRMWLLEHDIALRSIAAQLGMSRQRCGFVLNSETMTPQMHERFTAVGIPAHLLPPVAEKPCGQRKRQGVPCLHHATAV